MSLEFISCSSCNKKFLRDIRHINENRKLGHNFYCSTQCQSQAKNKQVNLTCENATCRKIFTRMPSQKSFRNFCSRSCAAIVNNKGRIRNQFGFSTNFKSTNRKIESEARYCQYCGKKVRNNHQYCSMKCWGKAHEIPKEKLIQSIIQLTYKLGRPPTRRECKQFSSCVKHFGSWNNAITAAGLTPHRSLDQKMYRRRKCIALDGHICNSISELLIDNWFYQNKLNHQKEVPYPTGKFIADWGLSQNTLIEYFGLANDSKRYDEEIKKKRLVCSKFRIRLIEIYSQDLFPKNNLNQVLKIQ